jgi:hypothetical protein
MEPHQSEKKGYLIEKNIQMGLTFNDVLMIP